VKEYALPDRLVWVDLETTGLDPVDSSILEIGIIVTDRNLREIATWSAVRHYVPQARLFDDPRYAYALKMHRESGLLTECARATWALSDLEVEATAWINRVALSSSAKGPLCGSSPHFDRTFLRCDAPLILEGFNHRNHDASAIAAETLFTYPDLALPQERPHRALPDLRRSIEIVRRCREAVAPEGGRVA
jgi:oligoribonuclease